MGIGHKIQKQSRSKVAKSYFNHNYRHGGVLRNKRKGRGSRPIRKKAPLHIVFKANKRNLKKGLRSHQGFKICSHVIKKYSNRFKIKIDSQAICGDHVHLVIRLERRSLAQHFLRVVAGQIAQRFHKEGLLVTGTPSSGGGISQNRLKLWLYRPFSRVVLGWKAFETVIAYVKLNEKEAQGLIPYRKQRLKGLSSSERQLLWS